MQAESLALAAIAAEQEARQRVVEAVATASEITEEGEHPLCQCQRITLLAALEGALGGFAVSVFVGSLIRAQEIEAGVSALADTGVPSLIEQYLGIDSEEQDKPLDPFEGNDGHSVASFRLEDIRSDERGVVERVHDYTGGTS